MSISLERMWTGASLSVVDSSTNCLVGPAALLVTDSEALLTERIALLIVSAVIISVAFHFHTSDNGVTLKARGTDTVGLMVVHLAQCPISTGSL